MAESVVSFLLDNFSVFLREEIELLGGVREEAQYVKDELEHITAFLRVVGTLEFERDPQVCTWVKQVREIAFDIEDVLDQFKLQLARDQREGFMRNIIRLTKTARYRHEIAAQIRAIKPRIASVSDWRQKYQLEHGVENRNNRIWHERRGDALLLEETDLVGIEKPKRQLIEWLVEKGPTFRVISVVGMGGLGKTTLVKKVYDDVALQRHFRSHAWVAVSQSFNLEELLKDLVRQLFGEMKQPIPQGVETMNSQGLKQILKTFLSVGSYLLVLDDVWDLQAWEAISYALPRTTEYANRVMLTTRNREVAEDAASSDTKFKGDVYFLNSLSHEMTWQLFCRKAFLGQECPPHLMSIAQNIVKRCDGLPLAIVAIGGMLATKREGRMDEWEMVNQNLGNELQERNKLQNITKILSLSYYDLPFNLKACLLYTSMFPEDYEIFRNNLTLLWVGERFIEQSGSKTMEEVADSYLNELVDRSLIQVASVYVDGGIRSCRIHDLLREVLLSKLKDQSFTMIVNKKNTNWHDEKVRRLYVCNTSLDNVGDKLLLGLRSLLVFGVSDFSFKPLLGGSDVRLMKVLDLEGTNLDIFPNEITRMYHLRFLSLQGTNVSIIPSSIGRLQNLEILNLSHTRVTSLPHTIRNLAKLTHLWVWHRPTSDNPLSPSNIRGFEATFAIGCLRSLRTLLHIELNQGKKNNAINIIEELGRHSQLRKLGILKLKREDGPALCSSIEKLIHLNNLSVESVDEKEILNLQNMSSPPQFLQWLYLRGRLEKVPHWITSLCSLTVLILIGSRLTENVLEVIQALPNLVYLRLDGAFDGEELCFEDGGFQKLKTLWLRSLQALKRVVVEKGGMPCIEQLSILNCSKLKNVPSGIENLSKLKNLELVNTSSNLIDRIDRSRGGEDLWRIQKIKKVDVFQYREGKWWVRHGL